MDLIAWIEAHLALLTVIVGGIAGAVGFYIALDRRASQLASGLAVMDSRLESHAESTQQGFRNVCQRLDTINGQVLRHERELGEIQSRCIAMVQASHK